MTKIRATTSTMPLEQEFERTRAQVLRRSSEAVSVAAALKDRLSLLSARVEFLNALAVLSSASGTDRARITFAVDALRPYAAGDRDVALEVAIGLLVTDRVDEATQLVDSWGGHLSPGDLQQLTPWVENLAGTRPAQGALGVLWSVVSALTRHVPLSGTVEERLAVEAELRKIRTLVELGQLPKALEALDGTPLVRERPDGELLRSEVLERLGRPEEALVALDRLPKGGSRSVDAMARRVRVLTALNRFGDAVAAGASALADFPDDVPLRRAYARALLADGKPQEALDEVEAWHGKDSDNTNFSVVRGEILAALNRVHEAVEILEQAVTIKPDDIDRRIMLARSLAQAGRPEDALEQLARAQEVSPARADVEVERVPILLQTKRPFEALSALDRAQTLGAQGSHLAKLRATIYEIMERPEEAADWYAKALQGAEDAHETRDFVNALVRLAYKLSQEDNVKAALNALEAPYEAGLLSPGGLELRAELLRLAQRWTDSLAQIQEALAAGGGSVRLSGTHAQVLHEIGRSSEALDVISAALAEDPSYQFGWSVKILALDVLDKVSEALEVLRERFLDSDVPEEAAIWGKIARAGLLTGLGRLDDAAAALKALHEEHPHNGDVASLLAVVLNRQDHAAEAVQMLQPIIASLIGEIDEWVLLELADGLARRDGGVGSDAEKLYRRILTRPVTEPRPSQMAQRAWATFRLPRQPDGPEPRELALTVYESAFGMGTNRQLSERYRQVGVLQTGLAATETAPELEALLGETAALSDHARRVGLLRHGLYVCNLLGHDRALGPARATLAVMRQRIEKLHTELTRRK